MTTSPTPCAFGNLAYFPGTSSLVLINTGNAPAFPSASLQTWQWKSGNWTLTNAGLANNPAPRTECGLGYDGTSMVLFGGKGVPGTELMNPTDLYSSSSVWTNALANYNSVGSNISTIVTSLNTSTYPNTVVQTGINGTYGLTIRRKPYLFSLSTGVILWGGLDPYYSRQDQWLWTHASQTWTVQSPANVPSIREGAAYASDGTSNAIIFGGASGSQMMNDTLLYTVSSGTWTTLTTNTPPSVRVNATLCWNPGNSTWLLFGGANTAGQCLNESFQLSISGTTGTWTKQTFSVNPSARVGCMMGYDTASSQLIMFGGQDNWNLNNETWNFVGGSSGWSQL